MSAVVPPPPPSGSILRKQSSFSRTKADATTAAAASASANRAPMSTPSNNPAPAQTPNTMARPTPMATPSAAGPMATPMRPMNAAPSKMPQQPPSAMAHEKQPMGQPMPPPPGMWGPNGQLAPAAGAHPPAMSPASGTKHAMPAGPKQPPGPKPAATPSGGVARAAAPPAGAGGVAPTPKATPKATPSAAAGAKRPMPNAMTPQAPAMPPAGAAGGAGAPVSPAMQRKNSMNGGMGGGYGSMGPGGPMAGYGSMGGAGAPMNAYGSMGPGGPMGGYGSMGGGGAAGGPMNAMGGYGSMGAGGPMSGYGSMGAGSMVGGQGGSMYGADNAGSMMMGPGGAGYGSMGGGQEGMGGSMYDPNSTTNAEGGMGGMGGSMYGQHPGAGSMMGGGFGSMYGAGGPFGSMGPGTMMGAGSMMGPMGSMYGMGGPAGSMYGMGAMSTYGIAAQWGSLANMAGTKRGSMTNRSGISSEYGGFATEATTIDLDDLCPNIGTFEDAKDLKRSGKRGGNRLYSRDKHEKIVATNNSNAQALTIRRKSDAKPSAGGAAASRSSASPAAENGARAAPRATPSGAGSSSNGKPRAKVPSNYNVHSLIIVDKASGAAATTVKDPSTVVYEKAGKKETFEADEAIERASDKEDIDSVLLSELRSNWFNGHNSSLMLCCGKGKTAAAQEVARSFIQKCIERLEKNEKDTGVKFDVTMSMVAIRGADQCCDLLKSGASYDKMAMGSSPVYGPCLLEVESKVIKTGAEASEQFDAALQNAKEEKEIVTAFYVLKTIKKTGAETEVHLSSMCLAMCGETVTHMTDIKDKAASSPHRLFRYAVDGACVTVSALCIDSTDAEAQGALEVERKMREVKNQPPRSGNVKRFVDFTYKEITRQKEKVATASGSEKKTREMQIERMEEMVKDANELLADPQKTKPKGYSTGR